MTGGEIVITFFIAFVSAGMGTLFWRQIENLRSEVRAEIAAVRSEMATLRSEIASEMAALRSEIASEMAAVRSDIASLRSDLTHVALAVGVRQPRASDG